MACLTPAEICSILGDPDCCSAPSDQQYRLWSLQLLCSLSAAAGATGIDPEVILLCDPVTGDRVVVIQRFDQVTGALVSSTATLPDGTPYVGAVNSLVSCDSANEYAIQYPICDNGVQKIVRICFNGCVPAAPVFYNLDLTVAAAPLDFNLVSYGECSNSPILKTICGCDDVNADGSVINNYVDVYQVQVNGVNLVSTLLGSYTDETFQTPYIPINPVDCGSIGTPLKGQNARRLVLTGVGAFTPNNLLTGTLSIVVVTVGNPLVPPTFTDSLGNVSPMIEGESFSYSISEDYSFFCNMPTVNTNAGDRVHIHWLEAC